MTTKQHIRYQVTLQSTKLKLYKSGSAYDNTSGKWTINQSDKRKQVSAEMRLPCPATGYNLLDQK